MACKLDPLGNGERLLYGGSLGLDLPGIEGLCKVNLGRPRGCLRPMKDLSRGLLEGGIGQVSYWDQELGKGG